MRHAYVEDLMESIQFTIYPIGDRRKVRVPEYVRYLALRRPFFEDVGRFTENPGKLCVKRSKEIFDVVDSHCVANELFAKEVQDMVAPVDFHILQFARDALSHGANVLEKRLRTLLVICHRLSRCSEIAVSTGKQCCVPSLY